MTYELAWNTWGAEELKAIHVVLQDGQLTMGRRVREFERAFCARVGAKYAVMMNSGSSANLIAVAALCYKRDHPLRPGDEVIVPAISWATTYHPLQQYGLRLRFVDVELGTLNMDTAQLAQALTPYTRMVVGVSILGNPCALDAIRAFCDQHGLYFLEDNCESMGASLAGKTCGTFGDIGTFSTFFSHHLSTMEGGILVTDDEELYHLALSLRAHGWTRDLPEPTPLIEPTDEDCLETYRFILPGYNVRPLEISGAVGCEQLKKLDRFIAARRRNAEVFQRLFAGDSRLIIQREHGVSSWFAFTFMISPDTPIERRTVRAALRQAGIGHRIITGGCFPRHDVIKYFDYSLVGTLPNANTAHDRGFFVGNHPCDLTESLHQLRDVLDDTMRDERVADAGRASNGPQE